MLEAVVFAPDGLGEPVATGLAATGIETLETSIGWNPCVAPDIAPAHPTGGESKT
ncbi:MAG: hypothetical protein ACREDC_13625 [Bradyrhizobium sp.]